MILDDATSAVDKSVEDLVQLSLQLALGHRQTTLLIMYQLKTLADPDSLLVMDDGTIAESGTPQELLQRKGGSSRGMVDQDSEQRLLENVILGRTTGC